MVVYRRDGILLGTMAHAGKIDFDVWFVSNSLLLEAHLSKQSEDIIFLCLVVFFCSSVGIVGSLVTAEGRNTSAKSATSWAYKIFA